MPSRPVLTRPSRPSRRPRPLTGGAVASTLLAGLLAACSGGTGGTTATPTPAPTVAEVGVSAFDVAVGDCFTMVDNNADSSVERVELVDCAREHTHEAYHTQELVGYQVFPKPSTLRTAAREVCEPAFEEYVGEIAYYSPYRFQWLVPSEGSWEVGDREVLCLVVDDDLEPTTGSARGSAGR